MFLAAGADREGESRGLGISSIAFKVSTPNPDDPFILENTFLAKGGPARHLHCFSQPVLIAKATSADWALALLPSR